MNMLYSLRQLICVGRPSSYDDEDRSGGGRGRGGKSFIHNQEELEGGGGRSSLRHCDEGGRSASSLAPKDGDFQAKFQSAFADLQQDAQAESRGTADTSGTFSSLAMSLIQAPKKEEEGKEKGRNDGAFDLGLPPALLGMPPREHGASSLDLHCLPGAKPPCSGASPFGSRLGWGLSVRPSLQLEQDYLTSPFSAAAVLSPLAANQPASSTTRGALARLDPDCNINFELEGRVASAVLPSPPARPRAPKASPSSRSLVTRRASSLGLGLSRSRQASISFDEQQLSPDLRRLTKGHVMTQAILASRVMAMAAAANTAAAAAAAAAIALPTVRSGKSENWGGQRKV